MRKIVLGRTNIEVSAISLGTWAFGGANMSGKIAVGWAGQNHNDSRAVLKRAWELDINHWDTADVYGDGRSESIIGEMWPAIPRQDIFIATKVGWDKGPHSYWYNPDHMRFNVERSLKNLKTDYIDLIYLHHCYFGKNEEYFDDAMTTIKQFQEEGKTRFIGLSDWSSVRVLQFIERCNPDVVQPYRNVMDDTYESSGLKNFINQNNLGVCFFSPLKHGLLTGKYEKPASFDAGDHRSGIKEFFDRDIIEKMQKNKLLLKQRFKDYQNPVMHGIVNALFSDVPTGCVLLGQRNIQQVEAASRLGDVLSKKDTDWVHALYAA